MVGGGGGGNVFVRCWGGSLGTGGGGKVGARCWGGSLGTGGGEKVGACCCWAILRTGGWGSGRRGVGIPEGWLIIPVGDGRRCERGGIGGAAVW